MEGSSLGWCVVADLGEVAEKDQQCQSDAEEEKKSEHAFWFGRSGPVNDPKV